MTSLHSPSAIRHHLKGIIPQQQAKPHNWSARWSVHRAATGKRGVPIHTTKRDVAWFHTWMTIQYCRKLAENQRGGITNMTGWREIRFTRNGVRIRKRSEERRGRRRGEGECAEKNQTTLSRMRRTTQTHSRMQRTKQTCKRLRKARKRMKRVKKRRGKVRERRRSVKRTTFRRITIRPDEVPIRKRRE